MTKQDLQVGEQAAHAFLSALLGWKEFLVQRYEPNVVGLIVDTADKTAGAIPAKEQAAADAVHKAISDAGYGDRVTPTQCSALAVAVYQAVLKARPQPQTSGGTATSGGTSSGGFA